MPLTQHLVTFDTPLNRGAQDLATQVDTYLQARRGFVQDLSIGRLRISTSNTKQRLRMLFIEATDADAPAAPSMGLRMRASLYSTSTVIAGATAPQQITADYASDRCRVPIAWIDVTESLVSNAAQQSILVIEALTNLNDGYGLGLLGHPEYTLIAEPLADIGPAATGPADIYDTAGNLLLASVLVVNIHAGATALTGQRTFAEIGPDTGQIKIAPTCCPALTVVADPPPPAPPPADCAEVEQVSITPVILPGMLT